MGLVSLLTACGLLRPGSDAVIDAIESAPGVTDVRINIGPGGGLATRIDGKITLDVPADELRDAFEEAWGRGVKVLHRRYDGDRGIGTSATGVGRDGAEISSTELIDLGASKFSTLGHFYDHYGIS